MATDTTTELLNRIPGKQPGKMDQILLVGDCLDKIRGPISALTNSKEWPCKIHEAHDLKEALGCLRHAAIDVIVLDLSLGGGTNLDVFFCLQQQATQSAFVLLANLENTALSEQALRGGAQQVLHVSGLQPDMVACTIRFAREKKRLELELSHTKALLMQSQKMEGIGQLAGGIAHDFNNLLTSILGFARLLQVEVKGNNVLEEKTEEIIHAGERAATLTRQLQTFGRKQVVQIQPIDLNKVVKEMDQLLRRTLGEDIELVTILGPDVGFIEADPGHIDQILMNLAVNARDAMSRGGKLSITTTRVALDKNTDQEHSDRPSGSFIRLSIQDNGCGMNKEVLSRAFEAFFTTKDSEKGTGLGLSTVKGLVRQYDGYLEVLSEPGKGTKFLIYFRALDREPEAFSAYDKEALIGGDETILLVEDEDTVRHLAERLLKELGYNVIQARNGSMALDLFSVYERPIHLVLTDVVMPQMGGPEMVEKLAAVRNDFKVLYMSGFTDDRIFHHGVAEGELHLLPKPYTRETLAQNVRKVLDEKSVLSG